MGHVQLHVEKALHCDLVVGVLILSTRRLARLQALLISIECEVAVVVLYKQSEMRFDFSICTLMSTLLTIAA